MRLASFGFIPSTFTAPLVLLACLWMAGSGTTDATAQDRATGRLLVETYCADCHAVGPAGDSPLPQAPRFRDLHQRYDVELLEEGLVEGLVTDHEVMPEFEFDPDQAQSIVLYLQSLERGTENPSSEASASEPSPIFGELTFKLYCASCHGVSGRADAQPAREVLAPADLTTLSRRHGGEFPTDWVRRVIDGRIETVGHTGVRMPPWGSLFAHELEAVSSGPEREAIIAERIGDLVAFLRTIQVE
jgi:mono/diheme cytochrome c family protein